MPHSWPPHGRFDRRAENFMDSGYDEPNTTIQWTLSESVSVGKQRPRAHHVHPNQEKITSLATSQECNSEPMIQLEHEAAPQAQPLFCSSPAQEDAISDSNFDTETAFLTPTRSNTPELSKTVSINHNLAASHSSTDLCDHCSHNVETLIATNTLRNAQLMTSSVDAMIKSIGEHMAQQPELHTEEARDRILDHLLSYINKEDGGTLDWETLLRELIEMGVVDEALDEGVMMRHDSSHRIRKRVRFTDDFSPEG